MKPVNFERAGVWREILEAAEYIKLLLPMGEIDVVVGSPLTDKIAYQRPFDECMDLASKILADRH